MPDTSLPDRCFAFVPAAAKGPDGSKSLRKLNLCNDQGELDAGMVGAAAAALGPGYRGNKVDLPDDEMATAKRKVREAWKRLHPDADPDDMPEGIRASEPAAGQEGEPEPRPTREYLAALWTRLKELVGADKLSRDDFDAAHRSAMSSAGGTRKAKKRQQMTDPAALAFAEQQHDGFLVALWLEPSTAQALAIAGGEPAEALHCTLCYCGDIQDLDELTITRAIAAVDREASWRRPLVGQVAGYGRFNASPTSDAKDVFYAAVDVPGLVELRHELATALMVAGPAPYATHGYTPHITLAYLEPGSPNPVDEVPSLPLRFAAATVVIGERRIDIPLGGFPSGIYSAAASEGAAPPGFIAAVRPLLFSLDQEWIAYLPAPGKYFHTLYGSIDLTPDRLQRIVDNHNANVYGQDIPINCEHDGRAAGAVGWIKPGNMRLAGDGSIEVRPEWNERGQALLEGDRFRYVSAEFAYEWQDPVTGDWHQDVGQGMAICTRPHFKTDVLKPLAASEAAALALVRTGVAGVTVGQPTKEEMIVTEKQQSQNNQPEPVRLSDDEVKAFREWQAGRDAETKKMADLEASVTSLTEANAKLVADAQTQRFTEMVMGRGKEGDGAVWAGGIQENVESLRRLATAFGEDSEQFNAEVLLRRTTAKQLKESALFRPLGTTEGGDVSGDAWAAIEAKAREIRASEPALSREQAEAEALKRHPELHEAYLEEQRQR